MSGGGVCGGGRCFPLQGVRVLAVEQYIAGPYCSMLLAEAGAEVIKVERPASGDPRRTMGPFITGRQGEKVSGGFIEYNRYKKSITMDLQKPRGQELFRRLAGRADVVLENFRPGVMDRLGLGYSTLSQINPQLIYVAISGFGQLERFRGPYWQRPAFDIVLEAMSGVMHMVGYEDRPPVSALYGLADVQAAQVAVMGTLMALLQRERTGKGCFVDVAMFDAMLALNERAIAIHSMTGEVPGRGRERHYGPRGAFRAKDGYVALNVPTDYIWERLAKAIGREDLIGHPWCADGKSRAEHTEDFLRPIIEGWMADKTQEEVTATLLYHDVPAGPVFTAADIARDPHVRARQMLIAAQDPRADQVELAASPVRLSTLPEKPPARVPMLGEHTEQVLRELLGMDDEELTELRREQVI